MAVLEKEQMLNLTEDSLKKAIKKGAKEAEVFAYEGQATKVAIERGQINKSSRLIDRGLSIRVIVNKAVGFAYTNVIESPNAINETIDRALSSAKASKPDPKWNGLPEKSTCNIPEKIFDPRILELRSEELVEIASNMLDSATNANKLVFPIEGGVGAAYIASSITNSNGLSAFKRGTIIECSLATVARKGTKITPVCFEFNAERRYAVDPEWVGRESARLAISALKTKQSKTEKTKLILTQFALQDLLYYTLINALKADNVQRNQSPLADKIGEPIAADNLTVYDEGLHPGGLRTWAFDDEGTSHQKTALIENGVLQGFLYDNYTAKVEGKESTGNASRAGYLSTPSIEATNFHIAHGNETADSLVKEVDNGFLIYYLQGAHSSNPVSGEFSVVATPAWKIRKGEIAHSTRGIMLAGNIYEVLKNVSVVANNERKMGQIVAPWILVEEARVIGK